MDESAYVVYGECSPFPPQENDVHKMSTVSNSFQTPSSLVMSSVYVSSGQNSQNLSPRTAVPLNHLMKEGIPLSHSEVLDSKSSCVSHINILPSNVLHNSVLSLQDDSVLPEENRCKTENGNEMVIANSCYGTIDNGSAYRLLLAPLPYPTLIKNNSSEKVIGQTLLNSNLVTSGDTSNGTLIEVSHTKDEHWTNENSNPLVLNTSSSSTMNLKEKKGTPQSQVVVKLFQDDLNYDMVEIISPHLDNSQILEIIEKDSEINKISQNKEIERDVSSGSFKFVSHNDNAKIVQQHTVDIADINPNCNIFYTCTICNRIFPSEALINEHKKECITYANNNNNNNNSVKETQINNEVLNVFQQKVNSTNDRERNKFSLKPNIFWECLICFQECTSTINLKNHYVSHSVEELATALLKYTLPTSCKSDKSNNIDQATMTEAQNYKVGSSIMGVITSVTESKEEQSYVESNKENTINLNPLDESLNDSKSFIPKSVSDLSPHDLKNKGQSRTNKKSKSNTKSKSKSKSNGTGLKSRDPHSCPVCKKVLSSRGNLAKHVIQHQTVKPWVCKVCDSGFNSKRNHDHHYMQRHTTLRPNVCNICGKGYTNKRTLTEHMIFHRKEKEFGCHLCNKSFRTKKCVNRHMQRHEKNRKFVCSLCFKAFRVSVDLASHSKLVHSSEKKKTKSKLPNVKSHANTLNESRVDQYSQNHSTNQNGAHQKPQNYLRNLDQEQSPITQNQVQIVSDPDQLHKIKDISDLLQSSSNSILPDISHEFQSTSLSEARETLFINGESIDTQSILPVTSTTDEQVYNNNYGLTLHNKATIINQDLSTPGTFVMIGLSESQSGTQNSSGKNTWNASHEYKTIYQDSSPTKESDNSQTVTEISLLPSVIENISRPYPDGMEQEDPSKFVDHHTADNVGLPKALRRVISMDKSVNEKSFETNLSTNNMSEKGREDTLSSDTQTQALSLDLLSQTLQLDFQSSHGNSATGFI